MVATGRRIAAALVCALPAFASAGEPGANREDELVHLLKHDCGSCHGLTMKGGLGPPLLPAALAGKDDALLIETILEGRPGTPMPPWRSQLSPAEAAWLVQALRAGPPQ
ncbi:MAG: cytochrome c [Rhodospirillales bacterium]|nr:cytochrome c [Rhodospirillales bacterium]